MNGQVNFDTLQEDVLAYFSSDPFFANVFLFAVKPGNIQSQVNQALSGLKAIGGKSGASIEIGKPFLTDPMADSPGPVAFVEMRFLVKTQPTINLGQSGTGIPTEQISAHVIQALLEWGAEGSVSGSFFPSSDFDSPADFGEGVPFEGRLVKMRAKIVFTPLPRTQTPILTGSASSVTITVAAPDAAAPVLYTTDGTAPGYVQGTANPAGTSTIYTVPFAVASGTVVRAIAIGAGAGELPSIINYSVVT
jgi:hypothetical protein